MNEINDTTVITEHYPVTDSKKRFSFHPKRFLRDLQQKLYVSPKLYLIFCFLVPVALMYGIYLTRGIHPFGNGTPLVLDLNAQYAYFFEGLRNLVYGDASSFLYSFSRSLGGEFMGMYAYYLASPLSYIVALFPQDRIQEAILTILLLKTGLCGLSFGYYLHRHTKKPCKISVFTFSVLYALSAYAVCQQSNTMWIDALIWLPLLALGMEQLILNKRYKLYTVALTFILISNYYIGYMICIFAVMFFFYTYFSKTPEQVNPKQEKLHFLRTGARFGIFSLLSAAISAFMLFAAYYSLSFGKSTFSEPDWTLKANFDIIDVLTKFLPGAYDTFEPSGLPFVYCGILALILLPVYFTAKKILAREKILSAALIGIFLVSFVFDPLDLIWHGFSMPNWLNGRYSFLLCFILLIIAYKGFGNLKQAGEKFLLAICGLIVLFVSAAQKFELKSYINSDEKLLTFGCVWFSILFTVLLLALLCLKIRKSSQKISNCISLVLAAVVCLEVFCNGIVCFVKINDDVVFTKYSSYQNFLDDLRPTVEQLKEYDDGFYRTEKTHHRQRNDNFALALKGISNSTSTLNSEAIEFIYNLGYAGRAHLTQYRGGTPVGDSILGIKYVIDKNNSTRFDNLYEKVEEIQDPKYSVYKNPYALSLAYGVSSDIKTFEINDSDAYANVFERYNSLIPAMTGVYGYSTLFEKVSGLKTDNGNCKEVKLATTLRYSAPEKSEGYFTFTYIAPYTGNYYFYPDWAGNLDSVNVKIGDGEKISFLERDTDHILTLGHFEEGSEIRLTFYISKNQSINFYTQHGFLWYFNEAEYATSMQALIEQPQLNINSESTDDHIFGTMTTANADQCILTTIPYDEGWKVYVDGEQVEVYKSLDALLTFDVTSAGDHNIELKYMPDVYKTGIVISIAGIIAFIAICAADYVLRRTLLKNKDFAPIDDFWLLEDFDIQTVEELPANSEHDSSQNSHTEDN